MTRISNFIDKDNFRNLSISLALRAWLHTIENENTRKTYSTVMKRLQNSENSPLAHILNENKSIASLDKHSPGSKGIHKLIQSLDIPFRTIKCAMSAYGSFCDYLRVKTLGIIDPERTPKQQIDLKKAEILNEKVNWNEFFSALPQPFDLIAEMTFLAGKTCYYTLRISDPRRNILSLNTSQINFDEGSIFVKSEQSYHSIGSTIQFPDSFMERLKRYLGDRRGLVFVHPKKLTKLHGIQVERAFYKACENLGYEKITPFILAICGCSLK